MVYPDPLTDLRDKGDCAGEKKNSDHKDHAERIIKYQVFTIRPLIQISEKRRFHTKCKKRIEHGRPGKHSSEYSVYVCGVSPGIDISKKETECPARYGSDSVNGSLTGKFFSS